ncbi:hypothetical protein LJR220_003583 [Bradyrhizobium sp. LjRoot220]|uniref:hypothetical protein n=1 Tax=Bradyrhizobium sp. LjRoot220 TaxID=3342284 RepID=UPI003ECECAA8
MDKELEKRGHTSLRAQRPGIMRSNVRATVMTGVEQFLADISGLRVNKAKVRSPNRASASSWSSTCGSRRRIARAIARFKAGSEN